MTRANEKTYWILDPQQIQSLASPRRTELLDRLAADGPMTAAELAAACRAKTTAVYHHLQQLMAVGLVEEKTDADSRAAVFATRAPRMRMQRALEHPENEDALVDVVGALTRQAERDFERGFDSPDAKSQGPLRNHGFFRLVASPSGADLKRLNTLLGEIAELLWRARAKGAPPVAFAWTLAPLSSPDDTEPD